MLTLIGLEKLAKQIVGIPVLAFRPSRTFFSTLTLMLTQSWTDLKRSHPHPSVKWLRHLPPVMLYYLSVMILGDAALATMLSSPCQAAGSRLAR